MYQVTPENEEQIATLYKLRGTLRYGLFSDSVVPGYPVNVIVAPAEQEMFLQIINEDSLNYRITAEDIERYKLSIFLLSSIISIYLLLLVKLVQNAKGFRKPALSLKVKLVLQNSKPIQL